MRDFLLYFLSQVKFKKQLKKRITFEQKVKKEGKKKEERKKEERKKEERRKKEGRKRF